MCYTIYTKRTISFTIAKQKERMADLGAADRPDGPPIRTTITERTEYAPWKKEESASLI